MKYPTTSLTLLDKIARGDEIGWNEFYQRYRPVVVALAKYKGLDDAAAEDVLQQVMLNFFQQSKYFRFDPDLAHFRTYFGRLVNARIADYYRHKKAEPLAEISEDAAPCFSVEDEDRFLAEFRKTVWDDVYRQLKQRVAVSTWQAFELYARQNRPVEKVAAFLGCSANQVYQAKKRCLVLLREIVADLNLRDPGLKLELLGNE